MTHLSRMFPVIGGIFTLGGCPSDRTDTPHGTTPSSDTATRSSQETEPILSATCDLEEGHAIRAWCEVSVTPPRPLTVTAMHGARGELLYTTTSPKSTSHRIPLLWLPGDSAIAWSIDAGEASVEGTLQTQPLPIGVNFNAYIMGTTTSEGVLFSSPCLNSTYAIITDTLGEVRWYQQLATGIGPALIESLQWTDRGTVLALLDRTGVVEVSLEGETLQRLDEAKQERQWHHDTTVRNGYTYVLFNETRLNASDASYLIDGVQIFDATGAQVAVWSLADHLDLPAGPSTDPAPIDWSHANSIWVSETGEIAVISLRHLSTVLAFRADPKDPDFGQIAWSLVGDGALVVDGSLSLESELPDVTGFQEQHHAHLDDTGRLVLFDNRAALDEDSRVLVVSLDLDSDTAHVEARHLLPTHCPYQGAAYRTDDGFMATCAPHATVYEVNDAPVPLWSMEAECDGLSSFYVPRFIPVSLGQ